MILDDKTEQKDDIILEEETGVEAGNKVKKPIKKVNEVKLAKGDSGKLIGELKKQSLRVHSLIGKLL